MRQQFTGIATQVRKGLTRRTRNGQSIVIIAFAFIALIAFAGIATDVALLFVRFSTLHRAVDAAAIATAGQVRETSDYMTLNAVARQFIQVHGIDPSSVKVETCETEIIQYQQKNGGTAQNANNQLIAGGSELCKRTPQKLVRVSAQIASPTAFLSVLGFSTITLQTSSVSQTAALDVAILLDTSFSEAADTQAEQQSATYASYHCYPTLYTPGYGSGFGKGDDCNNANALRSFQPLTNLGLKPFPLDPTTGITTAAIDNYVDSTVPAGKTSTIRYECWYNPLLQPSIIAGNVSDKANYAWAGCCNDPTVQADSYDVNGNPVASFNAATKTGYNTADSEWYVADAAGSSSATIVTTGLKPDGSQGSKVMYGGQAVNAGDKFRDYKGDGNYSDLICRPFKDVRDAARRFIKRLDFVRGDRVVLVTFDSDAKAITPYGSTLPIITDKSTAVRTLNMQVGVAVAAHNQQNGCHVFGNAVAYNPITSQDEDWMQLPITDPKYYGKNVNKNNVASYWTISQCAGTNTGGGILAATNALVDPNWIRRDAVWVMVVLSDGYPNRTPSWDVSGNAAVGSVRRDWLAVDPNNMPSASAPAPADFAAYCTDSTATATYGTKPEYCASQWGYKRGGAPAMDSSGKYQGSYGFCPTWTFAKEVGGNYQISGTERMPRPPWFSGSRSAYITGNPNMLCVDNDPDSRHFCMNSKGEINADPSVTPYVCDERYDPEDYARDRVDFAALSDYTATEKGNFIAMYSIFFNPGNSDVQENILGVKFMRYISDAGDNGKIDNPIQRWYRDARDGTVGTRKVNPPPSGGFAYVTDSSEQAIVKKSWTDGGNTYQRGAAGVNNGAGTQDWIPNYSATNPAWKTYFDYTAADDPCAQYDVWYYNGTTDVRVDPIGNAAAYNKLVQTDCGQYFYAQDANSVNKAFIEISSRLFTRLSR